MDRVGIVVAIDPSVGTDAAVNVCTFGERSRPKRVSGEEADCAGTLRKYAGSEWLAPGARPADLPAPAHPCPRTGGPVCPFREYSARGLGFLRKQGW
mmetsp:Transcript_54358/g.123753  ORF Transcript_54358/g.123753 Transcript_54358/m.123753 type:complete len:97 (-) Transcript_54358:1588-1878(-)